MVELIGLVCTSELPTEDRGCRPTSQKNLCIYHVKVRILIKRVCNLLRNLLL